MAAVDTDYHQRDLYEHIETGEFPSWTLKMQIMPFEDAKTYRFNPFDLTKVWPHGDYPLHRGRPADAEPQRHRLPRRDRAGGVRAQQPGGRHRPVAGQDAAGPRVLLRRRAPRPARGQLQADPGERAQGAGPQLLQGRRHADRTTSPTRCTRRTPTAARRPTRAAPTTAAPGTPTARWCAPRTRCDAEDDDWGQAGTMVREVLDDAARARLVDNIVGHLLNGVSEPVLLRAFEYWRNVDKDLGDRIEAGRARQAGREGPEGRSSRPTRPGRACRPRPDRALNPAGRVNLRRFVAGARAFVPLADVGSFCGVRVLIEGSDPALNRVVLHWSGCTARAMRRSILGRVDKRPVQSVGW